NSSTASTSASSVWASSKIPKAAHRPPTSSPRSMPCCKHTGHDNMGWWSDFTGKTRADAAKAAAADTYGKQQSAIARLLGYGDELKAGYDNIGASYQPYVNSANRLAGASDEALYNLIQNPDSVRGLPAYQFDQQEGQRAVDRSAAARGMDA